MVIKEQEEIPDPSEIDIKSWSKYFRLQKQPSIFLTSKSQILGENEKSEVHNRQFPSEFN